MLIAYSGKWEDMFALCRYHRSQSCFINYRNAIFIEQMKPAIKPYLREISFDPTKAPRNGYPFDLPAVRGLNTLAFHPDVTFLVGENGSGKSTLLEATAVLWGFNPEGGTINFNFSTRPSHSDLYKYLRIVRSHKRPKDGFFLRAESFFNLATNIEQLDAEPSFTPPVTESYGGRSLHEQSHGESFLTLLLHRFGGNGLYVLDDDRDWRLAANNPGNSAW